MPLIKLDDELNTEILIEPGKNHPRSLEVTISNEDGDEIAFTLEPADVAALRKELEPR